MKVINKKRKVAKRIEEDAAGCAFLLNVYLIWDVKVLFQGVSIQFYLIGCVILLPFFLPFALPFFHSFGYLMLFSKQSDNMKNYNFFYIHRHML